MSISLALRGAHAQAASAIDVGASAIPLLTRVQPSLGGLTRAEGNLTQPLVVATALRGPMSLRATLDLEGLTLKRGELTSGAWGEGFVDRRHPHTYLHELIAELRTPERQIVASLAAGRGFAPFGSDDPMVRPFVKYPADHHLAQILDRAVVIGAVRGGPAIVEGGLFDGDEPVSPSTLPLVRRFGDSWSARATLAPHAVGGTRIELTASAAHVRSPEYRAGFGLDQAKTHAAARASGHVIGLDAYALVEGARTAEEERGRSLFVLRAALAEGALCRGGAGAALRLEQSERPEELRLADPFRTERPATDVSILGITRWSIVTAAASAPPISLGAAHATLFAEIARARVARASASAFDPTLLYGRGTSLSLAAGARLATGHQHDRMGRYGAARPPLEPTKSMAMPMGHGHTADSFRCFR